MFDSNINECELLSITSDSITIDINKTKKENIKDALVGRDMFYVTTLMVQPTLNKKYFREIITKKLIPVCRIRTRYSYLFLEDHEYMIPNIPCFIKYQETLWYGERRKCDLRIAEPQQIKEYIKKHMSSDETFNKFSNELNEIFKKAEEYYDSAYTAAEEYNFKEKTAVKALIKSARKNSLK